MRRYLKLGLFHGPVLPGGEVGVPNVRWWGRSGAERFLDLQLPCFSDMAKTASCESRWWLGHLSLQDGSFPTLIQQQSFTFTG